MRILSKMEKTIDIDVCVSQTLSKTYTISTSDFTTEENGNESWHIVEKTDFTDDFKDSGHHTPEELIFILENLCRQLIKGEKVQEKKDLEKIMEECRFWTVDETISVKE